MSEPRERTAHDRSGPKPFRPPAVRLRQGLVLLAGALVLVLALGSSPARFYLGLGLIYLAAAAAGGCRGGYWATALVFLGWGAAVVWVREGRPDLDVSGPYLLGSGLGAALGVVLLRRGFGVDSLGLAATIAAAGLVPSQATGPTCSRTLARTRSWSALSDSETRARERSPTLKGTGRLPGRRSICRFWAWC